MTPEELLIPRYKCIAPLPFPKDIYKVGDILTDNGETAVLNQNGDPVFVIDWSKYPHLFQPLEWWECRKEEDMPEYLKSVSGPEVYQRVSRIDGAQVAMVRFPNGKYGKGTIGPIGLLNLLPATEQEYLEYIKQKEGK